jgi:hypothetical protein
MGQALAERGVDAAFAAQLQQAFSGTADWMRNQPG